MRRIGDDGARWTEVPRTPPRGGSGCADGIEEVMSSYRAPTVAKPPSCMRVVRPAAAVGWSSCRGDEWA